MASHRVRLSTEKKRPTVIVGLFSLREKAPTKNIIYPLKSDQEPQKVAKSVVRTLSAFSDIRLVTFFVTMPINQYKEGYPIYQHYDDEETQITVDMLIQILKSYWKCDCFLLFAPV